MRVIKVGGRVQSDPQLVVALGAAWKRSMSRICLVHGGGDEISAMQEKLGIAAVMRNGRRVTTKDDLTIVREVLSGATNRRLVSALTAAGVPSIGLSGQDLHLMVAKPLDIDALGYVGTPVSVNAGILEMVLTASLLPVISPVSACSDTNFSDCLNVNGDDAAAAIAAALHADELLFVSDVDGVRDEAGRFCEKIDADEIPRLVRTGIADGGMAAKLHAADYALQAGVHSVRIGGLETINTKSAGTTISQTTGVVG